MTESNGTRTLTFYGASDDLFEIEGHRKGEPDEIGSSPRAVVITDCGDGLSGQENEGLQVIATYATDGFEGSVWSIGIAQLDEDIPLPDWPMKWTYQGYSVHLTITTPGTAVVRRAKE